MAGSIVVAGAGFAGCNTLPIDFEVRLAACSDRGLPDTRCRLYDVPSIMAFNFSAVRVVPRRWLGWLGFRRSVRVLTESIDSYDENTLMLFAEPSRPVLHKINQQFYEDPTLSLAERKQLRDELREIRVRIESEGVAAWPSDYPRPTALNIQYLIRRCTELCSFLDAAESQSLEVWTDSD